VSAQAFYRADPRSAVGVILGKDRSDQPTDRLFQSRGFAEIVEKARAEFDIVVIDSAPVLPVVDPRFIVPFADAVLMVVGYDQAARQDLRDGYARIAGAAGDRPILTLLNGDAAPQRAYGTRGDYAQAY
jgi:ATPases involved in chromosome partitioning